MDFCYKINFLCFCILDIDVFVKIDKKLKKICKFEKVDDFFESILNESVGEIFFDFSKSKYFKILLKVLEFKDIFVWRNGVLEEMIWSFIFLE